MSAKELIKRHGLDKLTNRWLTLSEIGDNNIMLGYESSLSVIRPIEEVTIGDICMSSNFVGVVIDVYSGSLENDLGLKGVKVRYEDPYNFKKGEVRKNRYEERIFVFGDEYIKDGILTDTSNVNIVDMSSIKIVKKNNGTYKDEITKVLELSGKYKLTEVDPEPAEEVS